MKILAIAALAAIFACPVMAQTEFQEGAEMQMNNVVLCDTEAQITEIVTAMQDSFTAANAIFMQYKQTQSPYGGPACAFVPPTSSIPLQLVRNVGEVEQANMPDGRVVTVYVIEVKWPTQTGCVQGFIFAEMPLAAKGVAL